MYATLDDLLKRNRTSDLIQITDQARLGTIDTDAVDVALADATDEIASYLKATYDLTSLSPVPPVLVSKCCDMALYKLYRDVVPESVQAKYDAAVAWLKSVAKGVVKLDIAGVEPAGSNGAVVETCQTIVAGRRDDMRGYT